MNKISLKKISNNVLNIQINSIEKLKSSFDKNFEELPEILPLFPLSKVLLLPRAKLPLNLFENKYLHMLDYALANGRSIGMIQPADKHRDSKTRKDPKLYSVGCAGYITAFSQTNEIDTK